MLPTLSNYVRRWHEIIDVKKLSRQDAENLKIKLQARLDREDEIKPVVDELVKLVAEYIQKTRLEKEEALEAVKRGVESVRWQSSSSF